MSNQPGFFVVFEGGDGAGKSTQVKKLTQKLESLNETVVLVAAAETEIKFVDKRATDVSIKIKRFTAQLLLVPRQIPV